MNAPRSTAASIAYVAGLFSIAVTIIAAIHPFTLVFETGSQGALSLRAAALATWLVAVLTRGLLRWSRRDTGIVSLLIAFTVAAAIVVPIADIQGWRTLLFSVVHGLPQLLSTALPIATAPAVIGALVILVWIAALWLALLAVDRANVVAVLIVAATTFGAGIATIAGALDRLDALLATPAIVLTAAFAGYAFTRSVVTIQFMTRRMLVVRAVTGFALIAVAWTAGTSLSAALPFTASEPHSLRFEPEAVRQSPPEPVSTLRNLRVDAAEQGLVATVSGPDLPDWHGFLSVISFPVSAYQDGQRWVARQRFVPSGGIRPAGDFGGAGAAWPMRIQLAADRPLEGWLPFPSAAAVVDGLRVNTNQQGLLPSDPRDCLPTCAYTVQTRPLRTLDMLLEEGREIGDGFLPWRPDTAAADRSAGRQVCDVLRARLSRRTPPEPLDCEEARQPSVAFIDDLRGYIRGGRRIEEIEGGAPRLASTEQLQPVLELIGAPRESNPAGDTGQFATAFAVLADHFGIDARFVVGFRLCPPPDEGAPTACFDDTEAAVESSQAWAWVEINLPDIGWIIVDPSPRGIVEEEQELAAGAAAQEQETERDEPERIDARPDPSDVPRQLAPSTPANAWFAPIMLAALVVLAPAPAAVTRRRRRRRRRKGTPEAVTIGALHELVDGLYDAGNFEIEGSSAMELAEQADEQLDGRVPGLTQLGYTANRAVFSSRGVPSELAQQVWSIGKASARRLRRSAPIRYRLRALLRPAPSALTYRLRVFAAADQLRDQANSTRRRWWRRKRTKPNGR